MCFMPEVRTRKITGHLTATFLSATAMIHIPELGVKRENSKRGKRMIFSFTGFSLDMTYFEDGERSYVIWAQHSPEKISCLYLGEVNREEPWKLISLPMLLTEPEYDWGKSPLCRK